MKTKLLCVIALLLFAIQISYADSLSTKDTLIIGTKEAEPFVIKNSDGSLSGMSINLIRDILTDSEIEFKFQQFGSLDKLIQATRDSSVDLSISAISITPERELLIDFSQPYFISSLGIAVLNKNEKTFITQYLDFFSGEFLLVLLGLSILLVIFGVIFWLFEHKKNPDQFGGSFIKGIGSGFWYSVVTLCTVGYGDKAPKTLGGRIVATLFMIKSLVIVSSFTAAITTSLTLGSLGSKVDSKSDLYNVNVGTIISSSSAHYLTENKIKFFGYKSISQALKGLSDGEIDAFVYDRPIISYNINRGEYKNISLLSETFSIQYYGVAMPKGSSLRKK